MFGEVGVGREPVTARIARSTVARQTHRGIVCREAQIEVEVAGESGLVQNRPSEYQCKIPYQVRHVDLDSIQSQQL